MRRGIVVLALAALAAGCPRPRSADAICYKTIDRQVLLGSYNANASGIRSLSADLRMTVHYSEEGKARKRAVNALLNAEKPGRLRLRHDALGRDLFYVLSDGAEFWIGLDKALAGEEGVVYTGKLDALEDDYYFLRPDQLLEIFSLPPLPPAGAAAAVPEEHPGKYVFNYLDASAPPRLVARAVFSRVDLRLSCYQLFDDRSRLALEVEFDDYKALPQADVPHVVRITWPLDGISFAVRLTRLSLEPVPEAVWEYRWRDDLKIVRVETAEPHNP